MTEQAGKTNAGVNPNRVAIVTGAGSGIGRQVALALTADGFSVALAGRTVGKLEETAAMANGSTLVIPTDVAEQGDVNRLFGMVQTQFGRCDLLFNNAGINIQPCSVEDIDLQDWNRVVATNLTGMFLCTQAAVRLMKSQSPRGGRIINNGSISAHSPRPGSAAYTATKHAVTGLTKSTNLDCRGQDIVCGQIDIGNAATDMVAKLKDQESKMDAADVGRAVVYMANLPLGTNVPFMTVMANEMPYIGRG
ncbi:MAG: SDR family oxidoreductase [Aureliella sp.]